MAKLSDLLTQLRRQSGIVSMFLPHLLSFLLHVTDLCMEGGICIKELNANNGTEGGSALSHSAFTYRQKKKLFKINSIWLQQTKQLQPNNDDEGLADTAP